MKNKLSVVALFLILILYSFLYKNTGVIEPVEAIEKKEMPVANEIPEEKKEVVESIEKTKADKIIEIAKKHKGLPYKMGGTTKNGFDCSGLVMTSFKKEGVSLPRASYQMATKGKDVDLKEIKKGDLVFFKTNEQKPNKISHVGLVTSVDNGVVSFIHSTTKKGVIISVLDEEYYKKSFCKAKRIL